MQPLQLKASSLLVTPIQITRSWPPKKYLQEAQDDQMWHKWLLGLSKR
jgi:hypothetical protein